MKLVFILTMSLIISHSVYSSDVNLNCRKYYYGVCLSEISVKDFNDYLELHQNNEEVVIKGYQAVIWFLWADFYLNPIKKWSCYNKGMEKLDQLIASYAENAELRFLRLTIQDHTPFFLNYNSNIKEDKEFIHRNLNSILDKDLQEKITDYLCYNSMTKIK